MVDSIGYDVVPTSLIVKALRDSGYKNAAYALAELVDNSIQAGASTVEILVEEEESTVRQRTARRMSKIAVVDDGQGMNPEVLRTALQFGNGTRLTDRSGMGRFGMGLPNSSFSQAERVEVYTWQRGSGNAIYSYLDIAELSQGSMTQVPEPSLRRLPDWILQHSNTASTSISGTAVIWSHLERATWKKARTLFQNSGREIGRMYRRMLSTGCVTIRMASHLVSAQSPDAEVYVKPNDPMHLMAGTGCPAPWSDAAMFEPFGPPIIYKCKIGDEEIHEVILNFSIAKKEAQSGHAPGARDHGQWAKHNMGVSVVRAKRELELQQVWCVASEPRDRWWGCEVDFPPALDEVFGVTNNKQSATRLRDIAQRDPDDIAEEEGYKTAGEMLQELDRDGDPALLLFKIQSDIQRNLATIRSQLKARRGTKKPRGGKRHEDSAQKIGTRATNRMKEEGSVPGASDVDEKLPIGQREEAIRSGLIEEGLDPTDAKGLAVAVVTDGLKYEFFEQNLDGSAFFTVRPKGGAILIGLNTSHPAYDKLVGLLEIGDVPDDPEQLKSNLRRSNEGLKLLLEAWARYEDTQTDGLQRDRARNAREDWGRIAMRFFQQE